MVIKKLFFCEKAVQSNSASNNTLKANREASEFDLQSKAIP